MQTHLPPSTPGLTFNLYYNYESYPAVHVLTLEVEKQPLLLFGDPHNIPNFTPWELCEGGRLGDLEANVMAGRALLGVWTNPDSRRYCAMFILLEKAMQGRNDDAALRAFKRIAPKSLELALLPLDLARAFCSKLIEQITETCTYFNPCQHWHVPLANSEAFSLVRRFLTPADVVLDIPHDEYFRSTLPSLVAHGDGHILAVAVSLLLALLTGRNDLCIAGMFGAGKTRSVAVVLIAMCCVVPDFHAAVFTKENVAAKALSDQIVDLRAPCQYSFGRLLGRIEEGKGKAYATDIDVPCGTATDL